MAGPTSPRSPTRPRSRCFQRTLAGASSGSARGCRLGWLGEPFRSSFTADEMYTLLAGFRFIIVQDDDLARIATGLSAELGETTRLVKDMRIATAERR